MRRTLIGALVVGLVAATAGAGALDGHASAFDDGSIVWTGSTAFDNGTGVAGYIDWAVFAPGDFPFGGSGYAPTAGEMVYVYQLFSTGTDSVSSFSVALENPADNVGSFTGLSGDAVINALLVPAVKAEWQFAGITTGNNSEGLAFSSPYVPKDLFGLVIDGGTFSVAIPLPTPSDAEIPEPATMSVLALGGLALLRRRK
ncbi:MAG: PEP-CTERM sorting domain-containing protein [Planctomycetota bacterium]|jgi:hypothetical protein